ncbi:MAG: hypothetical protein ACREEM_56535, partial [Blastocatellia bacterium]
MKNGKPISLAISLVICLSTIGAFASSKSGAAATRIRFKRGESSGTVSGKLTSRLLKKTFLIGAKAGQILYANIEAKTSDGLDFANFIVLDPSGKPIADERTERIHLKQTGDYRIEVTPPG